MKITVIGANGQLGIDICHALDKGQHEITELTHAQLDIANSADVHATMQELQPDIVINTAAMHNVEACEEDPARAFAVNSMGARNLALASVKNNFTLMHISTDYVFDGNQNRPYKETDLPLPLNVYGNSKLAGEYFIQSIAEKYFILRVSGLYSKNMCRAKGGLNFVSLMIKLAKERDEVRVVNDEFVSPTFTEDIARQLVKLTESRAYGLYHVTAQGSCSWYEFAKEIFKLTNADIKLSPANPGEFPAKVARPNYSVLENSALQEQNMDIMPHWQDGLKMYLQGS